MNCLDLGLRSIWLIIACGTFYFALFRSTTVKTANMLCKGQCMLCTRVFAPDRSPHSPMLRSTQYCGNVHNFYHTPSAHVSNWVTPSTTLERMMMAARSEIRRAEEVAAHEFMENEAKKADGKFVVNATFTWPSPKIDVTATSPTLTSMTHTAKTYDVKMTDSVVPTSPTPTSMAAMSPCFYMPTPTSMTAGSPSFCMPTLSPTSMTDRSPCFYMPTPLPASMIYRSCLTDNAEFESSPVHAGMTQQAEKLQLQLSPVHVDMTPEAQPQLQSSPVHAGKTPKAQLVLPGVTPKARLQPPPKAQQQLQLSPVHADMTPKAQLQLLQSSPVHAGMIPKAQLQHQLSPVHAGMPQLQVQHSPYAYQSQMTVSASPIHEPACKRIRMM